MAKVTGRNAKVRIGGLEDTVRGTADFTLNISRDTTEQPLVGAEGNDYFEGALSVEGSFTMTKFGASGNAEVLKSLVSGTTIDISGSADTQPGTTSPIRWHFPSAQITNADMSFGDASTVTDASVDWLVLEPYNVTYDTGKISSD